MRRSLKSSQSTALPKSDFYYVAQLIGLAGLMYGLFHFSVFVTGDEVRYAIGLKNLFKKGFEPENYEMSFGFYLALYPLVTALPETYWPRLLNLFSALAGTILLIPLYFLVKSLFAPRLAFLTGLFLLFSPPYWLLSRAGHPSIIALVLFISAMAAFNYAIEGIRNQRVWLGLSILLGISALLVRVDSLLGFLVPLGLLHYKESKDSQALSLTIIFYLGTILLYLTLKLVILGYIFHPAGGTVLFHLKDRLSSCQSAVKGIIKNTSIFIFGFLPLLSGGVFLSLWKLIRTKQWRCLTLIILWVGPTLLYLPFGGLDFSRLSVPILIPLLLVLVYGLERFSPKRFSIYLPLAILVAAQATYPLTGSLLKKIYPFKIIYQNRPIASIPLESLWSDYLLRKNYLQEQTVVASQVAQRSDRNVVIITDSPHRPWYEYELLVHRKATCNVFPYIDNTEIIRCPTHSNGFLIYVLDWKSSPKALGHLLREEGLKDSLFHINPFMTGMPKLNLFLKKEEISTVFGDYLNHL